MAFELRHMTFRATLPNEEVGLVTFLVADATEPGQSDQWISAQVQSGGQTMKSVALNQINALHRARNLLNDEIERLTALYQQAEQAQR